MNAASPANLFDKVWDSHVVQSLPGGWVLLHIDRHLPHDLSGTAGLKDLAVRDLPVRNPELAFATPDHGVSTAPGRTGDAFAGGARLYKGLRMLTANSGIRLFDLGQPGQGPTNQKESPMKGSSSRRELLKQAGGLLAAPLLSQYAIAQGSDFPTKPIRIVVGYPPGQTVDIAARASALALSEILGKPVFVDNKAGANGILGAQEVKQAAPDGYTMLFGTSGQLAINPGIYKRLPYNPIKDFAPVILNGIGRLYIVVPATSKFKTLSDLVSYAKANPGKLSYGSGGRGITANLAMEMFKKAAGLSILHIPYKGSVGALTDLIGGQIDVMMDAGGLVLPQIKQDKLRALAVSSKTRYSEMPALPTVAEQGYPGFEAAAWTGVVVPANTPADVIQKLNKAFLQAQSRADVIASAKSSSSELLGGSAAEFERFLGAEIRKWGDAAKIAGVDME